MKHIKKIEIILTLTIGAMLIFFLFAANAISSPNTNLKITRLKLDKYSISPKEAVNLTYWLKPEGMISQCFNMGIDLKKGERKKRLKSWGLPSKLCDDLRQGRTISQTWKVDVPDWGAGSYVISIYADVDNYLKESNRDDNRMEKTLVVAEAAGQLPDLYISEFSLSPSTPTQGRPVNVRVGVYNRGSAKAKPFTVEWWAGENFSKPAKVWQVDGSAAKGGRILTYTYDGYRSGYEKLTTKAVADSKGKVKEQNEKDNVKRMEIKVLRSPPATVETSAGTCSISGEVSGAEVGFRIHLYGPDNFALQRDSKFMRQPGTYSFTSLPDGRYRISISIEGDTWLSSYPPSQIVECRGEMIKHVNFKLR